MSPVRVYELAKRHGVSPKVVLNELERLGVPARSASSLISADAVEKLTARLPAPPVEPEPLAAVPAEDSVNPFAILARPEPGPQRRATSVHVSTLSALERVIAEHYGIGPRVWPDQVRSIRIEAGEWAAQFFDRDEMAEWLPTKMQPAPARECVQNGVTIAMLALPFTAPGKPRGNGMTNKQALERGIVTVPELAAELVRTGHIQSPARANATETATRDPEE